MSIFVAAAICDESKGGKIKKSYRKGSFFRLVRLAGIEPARPCGQQILSLQRLPVPPQAHKLFLFIQSFLINCNYKIGMSAGN